MNRRFSLLCIILFSILFFMQCGNPTIHRYLIKVNKSSDAKVHLEPSSKSKMLIYQDEKIKIFLNTIEPEEIDNLAEDLGVYSSQRFYRLPGLTYLKFEVEGLAHERVKFNLFDFYFEDELKNKYQAITKKDYNKIYTSTSYSRFDYNFIYSFYVTEKEKLKPKAEFYFTKYLPEKNAFLTKSMKGFQIIPFEMLSIGSRYYTLHISLYSEKKKSKVSFYYRALRSDHEKK